VESETPGVWCEKQLAGSALSAVQCLNPTPTFQEKNLVDKCTVWTVYYAAMSMVSTRESILETALELIVREGVSAMTLERVAREAGISKGGLLYHYAGKEQIIEGLVNLLIEGLDRDRHRWKQQSSDSPGSSTRAFVRAALKPSPDQVGIESHQRGLRGYEILATVLGALASKPELLDPLRERYSEWQNEFNRDRINPIRATVARLAAEGLWFSEALGLAPPPLEQRDAIIQEILSLTQDGEEMRQQPSFRPAALAPEAIVALESSGVEAQQLAHQALEAAFSSARALYALQNPEGYWRGALLADKTLESDYVLLLLWLYPPDRAGWSPACRSKVDKALRSILARQLPDGGWNIYPAGPSEVNATARAYVALKVGGYGADHPAMKAARECVLELGGLQAANSYTKINLSLFGLFPRQFAPSVPPELVLMPGNLMYEISSWTRAIVVPLSIIQATGVQRSTPDRLNVEELYLPNKKLVLPKKDRLSGVFNQADKFLKLWERRGLKEVRAKAIREAEKWMLDHMRFSDGIGAIYPSMMYAIMAMDALGYERDQPDFVEALEQFENLIIEREDSLEFEPSLSPVWDTAISMFALGELGAGQPDSMRLAADWLLDREVRRKGDWSVKRPDLQPGGWAFQFANDFYPDIDDTAMVLLALQHAKASDPDRQVRAERRAVNWLLGMQSSDGGWAAFDVDNNWQLLNKVPFADHNAMLDPTCPDITGRVLEALCGRGFGADHPSIARGVQYLISHQKQDGNWYGRWGVNYIYGTFLALRGLRAGGSSTTSSPVVKAAEWLRSVQNSDGGWGESCDSYQVHRFVSAQSTPSQTAWALLGLEAAGDISSSAALAGVRWLLEHQNEESSWNEELMTGTGFPNVFYLTYRLYRHYFPLLALATWSAAVNHDVGRVAPVGLVGIG
jgi:squalene-hopene/tetraprenyl-beta-curcumene cyclase